MQNKRHIALSVNGERIESDIDIRMTLAEFLREDLGLIGTKIGCNRGECGCCTVILDDKAVYSCTVLAIEASGRTVTTIEGLLNNGELHPLQSAFIEHDAVQCGYCTPGMIMSLKALLDGEPYPKEEDIKTAIDGNFCRCGCYPNIVNATLSASEKMLQKRR
jgi:aerobic-type carbon monoxide dehydrogenase small subunit (CoxS/CutS family)